MKHQTNHQRLLITTTMLCFSCLITPLSYSDSSFISSAPIQSRFSSPVEALFNIPSFSETQILSESKQSASIRTEVTSSAVAMSKPGEAVRFDGETWRVIPNWKYGFKDHWQIAIELPLIHHTKGFLDNAIDEWHQVFNFREGSRDDFERNDLVYGYSRNGQTDFLLRSSETAIGDLRLKLSRTVSNEPKVTAHVHLKAPTGNASKLMSSGQWDTGISLSALFNEVLHPSLSWSVEAGQHYLGKSDQLTRQENWLTTLNTGVFWSFHSDWTLKTQLEAHTQLTDSQIEPMSSDALQLTIGTSWSISNSNALNFAFSEDVRTDSTSDVTFLFEWTYLY